MNSRNSVLLYHGVLLLVLGLFLVLYDPASGAVGFNAKAKTGLIAAGATGLFSLLWHALLNAGKRKAIFGAVGTITLFLIGLARPIMAQFGKEASEANLYALVLMLVMTLVSLGALVWSLRRAFARH